MSSAGERGELLELTFTPVTRSVAESIAAWSYEGSHAMYNRSPDEWDAGIDYMADPANRYFAACAPDGALVGFVSLGADGQVPGWLYDDSALDVGAGMAPGWIGRGDGAAFLSEAVRFALGSSGVSALRATIASWNVRALRSAARAGFQPVGEFEGPHEMRFTVLVRHS